ncbi:MAG: hypothetical protein ABMB14_14780 [Myxococcota bacterium]
MSSAHSHGPDVNPVIDAIAGRTVPAAVNGLSIGMIALGAVAFLAGLFGIGDGGAVAWAAFLVGLLYTLAIAQGGVMFSVIQTGTWGRWGRPIKRIAESFSFYLPVAYLMLIVFLLFGLKIYSWNPSTIIEGGPVNLEPHSVEAIASKPIWLTPMFFRLRLLFGVGLIIGLDFVFVRASLAPDMILATKRLGAKAPAWWSRITGGRTDVEGALRSGLATQNFLVPWLAVTYALVFSMVAFDLIMSLAPWWASNMFGAWTFVSGFWLSLCALGFTAMVGRDWLKLGAFIKPSTTHDLGKLMLVGCMFWAYTGFAQLLPIWYTDMKEETDFLLVRLFLPEWNWLAQVVGMTCFVAPFTILLSRGIKKMRWPFVGICTLIMCGIFMERTLLVLPSVHYGDPRNPMVIFVCVGTWLGFVGMFVQVVSRVLASIPPLVVSDPNLETHPWDVHVHPLEEAHGAHR